MHLIDILRARSIFSSGEVSAPETCPQVVYWNTFHTCVATGSVVLLAVMELLSSPLQNVSAKGASLRGPSKAWDLLIALSTPTMF